LSLHVVELYPDKTTPPPTTTIPPRQPHQGLYNILFLFTFSLLNIRRQELFN